MLLILLSRCYIGRYIKTDPSFYLFAGGDLTFVVIHDPEALKRDNPVENKYLKLMRYNRGLLDKDLKPDQKERNQLKVSLSLLSLSLSYDWQKKKLPWVHSISWQTFSFFLFLLFWRKFWIIPQQSTWRQKKKNFYGNSGSTLGTMPG